MEVVFSCDPADMTFSNNEQQVKQSYEADEQAEEEQLSEGRDQNPREKLGRHTKMPRGREEAGEADPVDRQEHGWNPWRVCKLNYAN